MITSDRSVRLSENDVRVAASLMGATLASGEDRIRASGLPRSSYIHAKRRLYELGVIENRYFPRPTLVGANWITFLVTRPFTNRIADAAGELLAEPGAVTVLSGSQTLFATLFHRSEREKKKFASRASSGAFGAVVAHLTADALRDSIPIYFDFEGIWSRFRGSPGTKRYPRPLLSGETMGEPPRYLFGGGRVSPVPLLSRPFGEGERRRPGHLAGPETLPRSQRLFLERGLVDWRVVLSLTAIPRYNDASISHLILTKGTLSRSDGIMDLFRALAGECGIHPFLLATDDKHVIMGTLGIGLDDPGLRRAESRPVLPLISRHLNELEVVREPLFTIKAPLWHRYDLMIREEST